MGTHPQSACKVQWNALRSIFSVQGPTVAGHQKFQNVPSDCSRNCSAEGVISLAYSPCCFSSHNYYNLLFQTSFTFSKPSKHTKMKRKSILKLFKKKRSSLNSSWSESSIDGNYQHSPSSSSISKVPKQVRFAEREESFESYSSYESAPDVRSTREKVEHLLPIGDLNKKEERRFDRALDDLMFCCGSR